MKTARFTSVVDAAGAPAPHPLWLPPEKDAALQRALKETRVMTLHQDIRGTRKDFGQVGLEQSPEAQYLVFPKSLARFREKKIVGIDYELLAEAARASGPAQSAAPLRRSRQPSRQMHDAAAPASPTPRKPAAGTKQATDSGSTSPAPAADAEPVDLPTIRRELQKAAAELKAGKAVAAHERLVAMIQRLPSNHRRS